MEGALRIYRTITLMLVCSMIVVIGMSLDLSFRHVRDEIQAVTASLTPAHAWQGPLQSAWPR
ncbi:MAG TPA: hypothetical protein VMA86_11170 [Acetobacteraceae bacterium]|nr:hypothetical protein [Acetobacteraceae bacterium]